MGFTKLDERILQSSIMAENPETFKVWIILLAACKEDGIAEVSAVYISSISHLSIESVLKSLNILDSPDPNSRSINNDGRRIIRVDGGFKIINYEKYREASLKSAEAERKRLYRKSLKECPDSFGRCPDSSASASASSSASSSASGIKEGMQGEIENIYTLYPPRDVNNNNRSTGKCHKNKDKIKTLLKTESKEEIIKIIQNYLLECSRTKTYLKNFSVFLNQLPEPVEPTNEEKKQWPHPPDNYLKVGK